MFLAQRNASLIRTFPPFFFVLYYTRMLAGACMGVRWAEVCHRMARREGALYLYPPGSSPSYRHRLIAIIAYLSSFSLPFNNTPLQSRNAPWSIGGNDVYRVLIYVLLNSPIGHSRFVRWRDLEWCINYYYYLLHYNNEKEKKGICTIDG